MQKRNCQPYLVKIDNIWCLTIVLNIQPQLTIHSVMMQNTTFFVDKNPIDFSAHGFFLKHNIEFPLFLSAEIMFSFKLMQVTLFITFFNI